MSALLAKIDEIVPDFTGVPTQSDGRVGYQVYGRAYFNPNDFKREMVLVGLSVLYLLVWAVRSLYNKSVVKAWGSVYIPALKEEFSYVPEKTPYGSGSFVWDGVGEATLYASGRRYVESLQATFHFYPWHDGVLLLAQQAGSLSVAGQYKFEDQRSRLTIEITLPQSGDNVCGVFGLVNKRWLAQTRTGRRFDLSFGQLADGENASAQRGLSDQWAILSESGELTDVWLGVTGVRGGSTRDRIGIQQVLNTPAAEKWLESIIITDQPRVRPTKGALLPEDRPRQVVVTLQVPTTAADARATLPFVALALNIADAIGLAGGNSPNAPVRFRPELLTKIRKTRKEVDVLLEEEAHREEKEAEEEALRDAKAKSENERFKNLSSAEQAKRKEIERKRALKKGQKTMRARA